MAGALWVSVPPGGVEVQVNHGGFSALVSGGAVMVDAGEGSDGLLLVTSGEALLGRRGRDEPRAHRRRGGRVRRRR